MEGSIRKCCWLFCVICVGAMLYFRQRKMLMGLLFLVLEYLAAAKAMEKGLAKGEAYLTFVSLGLVALAFFLKSFDLVQCCCILGGYCAGVSVRLSLMTRCSRRCRIALLKQCPRFRRARARFCTFMRTFFGLFVRAPVLLCTS